MSSAPQATRPTLRPLPRPRGLTVVPVVSHDDEPNGDLDTMVDMPAATPRSDIRELAVQRPPRPTPRSKPPEAKPATLSALPPPLPPPVVAKTEPATTETDTMELDASCIEEVCALAAAAPSARARAAEAAAEAEAPAPAEAARSPLARSAVQALEHAVKASRQLAGLLRAVAFFVAFAAMAAIGWLRATFLPATRAAAADARARLVIEWQRASARARSPAAERSTRVT